MDYLQKISDFFIIFGLFWLLKLHFVELWLIWEEGKMQDDPGKKRIVPLQSESITLGSAESPSLLYCQVVSLTLLQAACADYSNNEDAHLPLFHLWTKWIVFSCWSDWEKSIEKCFENFTAVKIGNWYRHSFAHFIPHFKKLGWLPCLGLLQSFRWRITIDQGLSPFQQKCSQLWSCFRGMRGGYGGIKVDGQRLDLVLLNTQ